MKATVITAALVAAFAATTATPSFAASHGYPANGVSRQYESLVQTRDDAAPSVVEQHQGRTINAWGHTFTVE